VQSGLVPETSGVGDVSMLSMTDRKGGIDLPDARVRLH